MAAKREHDAFLTYAWAEGTGVASALQQAISTIGTPWYGTGRLSVHRDTTDTEPSGSLRSDLFAELDASRYLILLASPKAARSRWVEREVGHWLSGSGTARLRPDDPPNPIDRLLLVLLDGEVHWDRGDFDWSRTDCLPRALSGRYSALPRFVDLRWAVGRDDLSVLDPDFRSEAATIAAPVLGTPRRALVGRDVRERRRARRTALSVIGALALLLVVSLGVSAVAIADGRAETSAHHRADANLRTAAANAMRRDAARLRTTDPGLALRLGLAAQDLAPGEETHKALATTLAASPFRGLARAGGQNTAAALSADGTSLLTLAADGAVAEWRLGPLTRRSRVAAPASALVVRSPDGRRAALAGADVRLWDYADVVAPRAAGTVPVENVTALAFSLDGATLATGTANGEIRLWDVTRPAAPEPLGDVLGGGGRPVTALAFSPERDLLAYARSGGVRLWDVADRARPQQRATIDGLADVTRLAFGADGQRLAVTSENGAAVRVADVADPAAPGPVLALRVPSGVRYTTLVWSPDGTHLAGGGTNGTVTTWDAATRAVTTSAALQSGPIRDVMFGTGSATVVSAAADGTVITRDAVATAPPSDPAALVSEACRRAGGALPRDAWASYAPGVTYHDVCAP